MLQRLAGLFLAFFIFVATANATEGELWGGTRIGMSPHQVVATVKGARPIQNGQTLGAKRNARELVRLDDFALVNEKFDVHFYFQENKLLQVSLELKGDKAYDSAIFVFDSLVDALRMKYGKEQRLSKEPSSLMSTAQADWTKSRTNINLILLGVGKNPAVLNINYQMRVAAEADKL